MQIFITGGTGLIGQRLITRLAPEHHITVLSRSESKARATLPAAVSVTENLDAITNFDDFDVIINLVGEPIESGRSLIDFVSWDTIINIKQIGRASCRERG
mgnify:CR=1 FL=1